MRGYRRWIGVATLGMALAGCGSEATPDDDSDDLTETSPTPGEAATPTGADSPTPPDDTQTPTPSSPSPGPETSSPSPVDSSPTPDDVLVSPTPDLEPSPSAEPSSSPEPTFEPHPSPTPELEDSPTPGETLEWVCPEGMSGVFSSGDPEPVYCIDVWEVTVTGDLGSSDQYAADAEPTEAVSASLEGVIPSKTISYDQAVEVCANTPVYTPTGELAGFKRMATSEEWQDAGDGVVGPGGSQYPYGDAYDETACATLDWNMNQQYDSLQPTGSLERCVSAFGVYDLSGNAWEWTDPGIRMDIVGWFTLAEGHALDVQIDGDGFLYTGTPEVVSSLRIEAAGVSSEVLIDDAHYFATQNGAAGLKGYLQVNVDSDPNRGDPDVTNFLPIQIVDVEIPEGGLSSRLLLLSADDGAPVPDKRGCAYYSGNAMDCGTTVGHLIHYHDFDGTINFRCVAEPIRLEGV